MMMMMMMMMMMIGRLIWKYKIHFVVLLTWACMKARALRRRHGTKNTVSKYTIKGMIPAGILVDLSVGLISIRSK